MNEKKVEIASGGKWTGLKVPADFKKALKSNKKANALWLDITPIARRDWIIWILSGKLAETRKIRIGKAISKLNSGMRRVCCFPGYKWLEKMEKVRKEIKINLPGGFS